MSDDTMFLDGVESTMFLDGVESRLELLETVVGTILKTIDKSKLSDEEKFRIETFTFLTWRRSNVK